MGVLIFDFECTECGNVTEAFVQSGTTSRQCPECGAVAKRKIPTPHFAYMKMGVDPHGCPTAAEKWAKAHIAGAAQSDD